MAFTKQFRHLVDLVGNDNQLRKRVGYTFDNLLLREY